MDIQTWITIAAIAVTNIGSMLGLFMWATTHASTDAHNLRGEAHNFRAETTAILKAISDEMKDFHGRLCAIEERAKNVNKGDK